jgi:hypothetical protein
MSQRKKIKCSKSLETILKSDEKTFNKCLDKFKKNTNYEECKFINFELQKTSYDGIGLFYTGEIPIKKDGIVFVEEPFMVCDTIISVKDFSLEDCAAMAFMSLNSEDMSISEKLKQFEVGTTRPETFNTNVNTTYKDEIKFISNYLIMKNDKLLEKETIESVFNEICKHALYRIVCKEKLETISYNGSLYKIRRPIRYGQFEYSSRINHSCDPNVIINLGSQENTISFTAIKQINKGDEITYSYSDDKSNFLSNFGFECECKKCNKDKTKSDGRKRKSKKRKSIKRKSNKRRKSFK